MAFVEYGLPSFSDCLLSEKRNDVAKWSYKARKLSPSPLKSLEDEIYSLRKKMELTFVQEKSLSSDPVMEISRLLDLKINEYMKKKQSETK